MNETLPEEQALGVFLCVETDTIGIRVQLAESKYVTRSMLSTISAMYEPLGMRWMEGIQLLSSVGFNRCFRPAGFGAKQDRSTALSLLHLVQPETGSSVDTLSEETYH